jgi:hypothetical protein
MSDLSFLFLTLFLNLVLKILEILKHTSCEHPQISNILNHAKLDGKDWYYERFTRGCCLGPASQVPIDTSYSS